MRPDGSGPLGPSDFGVDRFTVPAVLDRRAHQHPERVMMSIAGIDVTFEQMRQRSCAAANLLTDLGVERGDRIALFTGTCPEWIYFWLGAARIGAVSAAINAANKGDFLLHALRASQAKVMLTDAERRPRAAEVADAVETLTNVVVQNGSLTAALSQRTGDAPAGDPGQADDLACLFFTSGTTGPSKAVATTWHYLFSVAATVSSAWQLREAEVLWTAMPLFHLSAAPSILVPMLVGSTTVLAGSFHPGEVWDDIRARGAVGFAGAGAMVSMLQTLPADPGDARLPLRFISAAPIDANSYRDIEKRYGCRVVTMYGLTEAFPIAVKTVADDGVPGTSGRPNPDFEVRILDERGNALPPDAVGEIACRPRRPHVMSEGYVAADSRIKPHPEWFRTGDLGRLDRDQNLTYVDRIKDALRRRGENISSVEVEAVVTSHPAVAEAAAVGVPSELGEDDVLVVVTLRPGATLDFVELLDFCSARMPYFCVPRFVEIVSELPKNAIGRIRKDLLRERGVARRAWDRESSGYVVRR
ncbi:AMP-binding protein [Mycobacterium arosiense]|uniref:ATP-dependent acyl-CoA ligase n=1 Tax=Mycobacterium arosiense ATCC BAA-1401 = DSM 45069 TaxID=1265311 RepID=A0A1W9ZU48_MYCAI|nr:AMP-binding protein [Mycobacterium arosiense]ORA21076.1 ATP-dependent acyl-CoA ligase [Mycobacterium arosiense ATCC BAA-1401 = DSM 45069]